MLSDAEIEEEICTGSLRIEVPFQQGYVSVINRKTKIRDHDKGSLQAHGYDLKTGAYRYSLDEDWKDFSSGSVSLEPGKSLEIRTLERLVIPNYLGATIHSMVRARRVGMSPISTTVHPGWGENTEGMELEVHITNLGEEIVEIEGEQAFCRIIFHRLGKPANLPPPDWSDIRKRERDALNAKLKERKRTQRTTGIIFAIIAIFGVSGLLYLIHTLFVQNNPGLTALSNTLGTTFLFFSLKYINDKYRINK